MIISFTFSYHNDHKNSKTSVMTETYEWLIGVINSCHHDFHLECVDRLIELFFEKYKDESHRENLVNKRHERWANIHAIII